MTEATAQAIAPKPASKLTDLVPEIRQPLFLIWAPNGGNVETMNPEYFRLAGGPKQIWSIPDAKHVQGITAHPREYERRVVGLRPRAPRSQLKGAPT